MEYPPSKRHKGLNQDAAFHDPFEDDEDFTQDDLNEIDIIASQAFTGNVKHLSSNESRNTSDGINQKDKNAGHSSCMENEIPCNGLLSNAYKDFCSKLEAQKTDLKKKLKTVEEEILMKNGEIRVLRDSLRVAQQEKEQQRQAQFLLEREKAHEQSEKEKELSKKVQSLQSELHFKEAEMNEMKTKLQNSERGSKIHASPVTRHSPRVHCSAATSELGRRSSSASPAGSPFITKETFAAQLSSKSTPVNGSEARHLKDDETKLSNAKHGISNKANALDPFDNTGVHHHHPGSVLLSQLLQYPLDPSNLGLCHVLCISPETLPTLLQNSYLNSGSLVSSSSSSTESKVVQRDKPHSHFSQLQSLAMSGLNMMALPEQVFHINSSTINSSRSCPGAVYLLPLLDYHISLFCQTLESLEGSCKSPLRVSCASGSSSEGSTASSVEDSLGSLEEFALSSMRVLYYIISQSSEAVRTILSYQPQESSGGELCLQGNHGPKPTLVPSETQLQETGGAVGSADMTRKGLHIQHRLLRKLLELADPAFTGKAIQREALVTTSLSTLCMLAERAEERHLCRLKCVLSGQAMAHCLSLDSTYQTMSLSLMLLTALVDNDELATILCSHSVDSCLFLKIFQYLTSRPDKMVTDGYWSLMEVEMVRFLTKLFTQNMSSWVTFVESSCQCHSEVVQTVVVLLHRQWLDIRGQETTYDSHMPHTQDPEWWSAPGVQLLRETLLFLHWLLINHSNFSEHCRPVLHMYDQIIPAIRDTLRKIPDLTESEELALDEICRPETEDTEHMDTDNGC